MRGHHEVNKRLIPGHLDDIASAMTGYTEIIEEKWIRLPGLDEANSEILLDLTLQLTPKCD